MSKVGGKVPRLRHSRIVPATIQAWGETFHREANLDEWFGQLCEERDLLKAEIQALNAEIASLKEQPPRQPQDSNLGGLCLLCNALTVYGGICERCGHDEAGSRPPRGTSG